MRQSLLSTLSALSGVLAAAMVVVVVGIAAYFQPGYSHTLDMISELNAESAQYSVLTGYFGFIPIGLVTLFFLWRLKDELMPSRRAVVALIFVAAIGSDWLVTALAPCDAGCPVSGNISISQKIHLFSGLLTTFLLPIGVYLLIDPLRQASFSKAVIAMAFVVIGISVVVFILMVSSMVGAAIGLLQRINVGFFYGYLALLSIETYRRAAGNRS